MTTKKAQVGQNLQGKNGAYTFVGFDNQNFAMYKLQSGEVLKESDAQKANRTTGQKAKDIFADAMRQ